MAAAASFLLVVVAPSPTAVSTCHARGNPAVASLPSSSCTPSSSLRASAVRALQSRVVASTALAMQPPIASRVSTVVNGNLGDRSYLIYIGASLLDEPDLLQRTLMKVFNKAVESRPQRSKDKFNSIVN
ncbi:hypothetical protein E2562_032148 [Oryza meyeriana var. granulata]|uniref:Uncharacterized protein n=1 Tax=Oryza meyeriana var. granulata TaxID=110450 RepID=A0A6G1E5V3_9ORYZ|nr:hypothetical protein E2562_032148 [Oryza meyeriana var. granulata]